VERIGHYKIVAEIGRGGMGVVYKAHEESLNRFVAIKMLGEHLEEDSEYVERFVREAQSAAALSHPNIVQIYSIAEENGHHYFVMEYVHGTSVQRMIQTKGKIPPPEAARFILQAAAGLQDAHAHDVVHRDIKPANLMVTDRGLVKIADFGLALMGSATTRLTATGMLMGTPGYLSPEQCLDQSPDHRTDIYSLGVTFFEMVTGTMPFRADSPLALLKLIVEVEPPDICELNPEVDDELRAIIARMLAKDREARYPSCAEIIDDLQSWLEARGEPLQRRVGAVASGAAAGVFPPPPPAPSEDDINTQPTVAVASGTTKPAPPQPPPPPPEAVAAEPPPRTTKPATQPQPRPTRSHLGWIIAAIAVLILGGGAIAAMVTVKSGVLDFVFKPRSDQAADRAAAVTTSEEAAPDTPPLLLGEEEATAMDEATGATTDPGRGEVSPSPSPPEPVITGGGSESPAASGDGAARASENRTADASPGAAAAAKGTKPIAIAPRPTAVAAPPTATVVLAFGERLLAGEAEAYVNGRLRAAGIEVIEATSIPELGGFTDTESRPGPEQIRAALQPYARYLVPIRVEFLGDRPITYMGQRDIVYQSRVNVALVDLATGRPVGRPTTVKLEYTQLNADEVVSRELRRAATSVVQQLPRD
jgi:serine/threonine protein kinase